MKKPLIIHLKEAVEKQYGNLQGQNRYIMSIYNKARKQAGPRLTPGVGWGRYNIAAHREIIKLMLENDKLNWIEAAKQIGDKMGKASLSRGSTDTNPAAPNTKTGAYGDWNKSKYAN